MSETTQPNEAADPAFSALRSIAQAWRCWDRTENPRDTEGRILDGAVWGILTAIREGKAPGGIYIESPGIDYLKIRQALSGLSDKPAMAVVTLDHIKAIGEQIASLRSALAAEEETGQRMLKTLYDAIYSGEPQDEREVRWKWVSLGVSQLREERDQALAKLADAEERLAMVRKLASEDAMSLLAKLAEAEKDLTRCRYAIPFAFIPEAQTGALVEDLARLYDQAKSERNAAIIRAEKSEAKLAASEASLTAARDDLLREGMERDEARAKLAEAERERDVLLANEEEGITASRDKCMDDLAQLLGVTDDPLSDQHITGAVEELLGERDALAAQLAEARWIPCSERMPTGYDNWVLAWHPKWPRVRLLNWCKSDDGHWRNESDDRSSPYPEPTHWKIPAPPSDRGAEGEK